MVTFKITTNDDYLVESWFDKNGDIDTALCAAGDALGDITYHTLPRINDTLYIDGYEWLVYKVTHFLDNNINEPACTYVYVTPLQ